MVTYTNGLGQGQADPESLEHNRGDGDAPDGQSASHRQREPEIHAAMHHPWHQEKHRHRRQHIPERVVCVIRDLRVGLPFQAQQGGVMVESEPEHGSFFTVWLPAAEPGI